LSIIHLYPFRCERCGNRFFGFQKSADAPAKS
jgi:hypothetical protein